jgi:hypothetical protein
VSPVPIPATDRGLYEEYGLSATESAEYASQAGRKMGIQAFRFSDSEGAAYLWLRPSGAVKSPLNENVSRSEFLTEIHAEVGGGVYDCGLEELCFPFSGCSTRDERV